MLHNAVLTEISQCFVEAMELAMNTKSTYISMHVHVMYMNKVSMLKLQCALC